MKTRILIEVDHKHPIPYLADMIAGRAYTIAGVTNAEVVPAEGVPLTVDQLEARGFTPAEIALGAQEVRRG